MTAAVCAAAAVVALGVLADLAGGARGPRPAEQGAPARAVLPVRPEEPAQNLTGSTVPRAGAAGADAVVGRIEAGTEVGDSGWSRAERSVCRGADGLSGARARRCAERSS
ncbi:hypothetical protein ACVGVM_09475 [Pseudonocardia bannensis]|uniref:Uncharacterized protein n=1 Tax=Pseudonocardia bannensis TaxID=630973 RepID=A0A848DG19_9PSEU|nr:hypothetical protein [Pseudonocardia bannensis]NMH91602.1 hypothetical protein [Pseudonocardia bannensis]